MLQPIGKAGLIPQLVLGKFIQAFQPGAFICLRKNDVKTQHRYFLAIKQFVGQISQLIPSPRPPPDFCQAFFVNVNNDNAIIQRLGHGHPQARIVNDVVQALQDSNLKDTDRMH